MKIDLHLHLDGSLRPHTVWELAREQGIVLPAATEEELVSSLRVPEDCRSLTEYLERFDLPLLVLQKAEAVERVTYELVEDLSKQGLTYAEIRFAPQLSTKQGLAQKEVVQAAVRGLDRALADFPSIRAGLILCFMRGAENSVNEATLEAAKQYLGKGVLAVDLAGAEALFKTADYEELFKKVREAEVPFTIHAGEADGPESVRKALEFGTKRLGHGVRAIEDKELIEQIIRDRVTLEVCPISNLHTKLAKNVHEHPIRRLFDMGVRVTVNTDNMTVSNTCLDREYAFLKEYYGFTDAEIAAMNEYAEEAAFMKF
ncbi:MAG: adenosine deaminase [Lachnospiraceae bacterium]|nr:adenosine deaminase [Lachnospiraceae bacterium]